MDTISKKARPPTTQLLSVTDPQLSQSSEGEKEKGGLKRGQRNNGSQLGNQHKSPVKALHSREHDCASAPGFRCPSRKFAPLCAEAKLGSAELLTSSSTGT